MQGVILAAGCGSRLASVLQGKPKCLAQLEGVSLIEYQLAVLRSFGINDVCVVLGYRADEIREVVGDRCHWIINNRYAETNSLYSLWLARNWVRDSFVLMNSDVLAHPQVYERLLETPGNVLAYDSWSGNEAEHMKVAFNKGKLQQISKTLDIKKAQGESLGVLKFTKRAIKSLFKEAEASLAVGGANQWAPAAIQRLARKRTIAGIDVAGLPWVEIDFPQDLQYACNKVWPAICKTLPSWQRKQKAASPAAKQLVKLGSRVA
ncbi:phosphocholine cytidylyltransferase family protein [Chlorogloeopsis sp. ULAP02]|uniref:phosphocholine cytidylyltransferase family protein n=1 Tax=Chlorogloeopsis sp. ULAP02 TaxID=3107926 RepID=UPI003136232E